MVAIQPGERFRPGQVRSGQGQGPVSCFFYRERATPTMLLLLVMAVMQNEGARGKLGGSGAREGGGRDFHGLGALALSRKVGLGLWSHPDNFFFAGRGGAQGEMMWAKASLADEMAGSTASRRSRQSPRAANRRVGKGLCGLASLLNGASRVRLSASPPLRTYLVRSTSYLYQVQHKRSQLPRYLRRP